ncbi:hypothetical protein C9J03_13505 [Photobacterium gaetbulicola]|uniref:Uncharacterized protein n=2 Tax=Photobacterium gaetbulicola TaxID=1295392 RepID=A0A0C5WGU0_9GAMM|nr:MULTISPECIES: hypothetical protein [Photobacterium]AJR06328.1 hypothetical protein H744_1c1305 [Photobacterium gaetbulicola Gung47]KHT63487.1 hypothetical protein RJ45_11795 [Photobacterium gaetbulicola]PSU08733.1 hypothetical protein C9J03_13505 [Photobacterium gaetbulicola]WEM45237.1 hypothetical protein PTW35_19315 [Photobacterium sp. DA100]
MRNIADFIEQLEKGNDPFNVWVYSSKGQYSQFSKQGNKISTPSLQRALNKHLQVVVEMNNESNEDAFLLLPEVHAVVPVSFRDGQVQSLTRPN